MGHKKKSILFTHTIPLIQFLLYSTIFFDSINYLSLSLHFQTNVYVFHKQGYHSACRSRFQTKVKLLNAKYSDMARLGPSLFRTWYTGQANCGLLLFFFSFSIFSVKISFIVKMTITTQLLLQNFIF